MCNLASDLFELIHEQSEPFRWDTFERIHYSKNEFDKKYKNFQTMYPFKLTGYHPIIFYHFMYNTELKNILKNHLKDFDLFLEIYKVAFQTVFKLSLSEDFTIGFRETKDASHKLNELNKLPSSISLIRQEE